MAYIVSFLINGSKQKMLTDDLFKTDWDHHEIHFSIDRRLDEQAFLELTHLRYVKRLTLYQDAPLSTLYKPGPFLQMKLNKLFVQHLTIHCKNFHKTKEILRVLKHAHVTILEIVFENNSIDYKPDFSLFKVPSIGHIIFNNVSHKDTIKIKWLLEKSEDLSTIWLDKVSSDVTKLHLPKHIDNLHVSCSFPFKILDPIKVKNLYIHVGQLQDLLRFNESMLAPFASTSKTHTFNNVIIQSGSPLTYLIKVIGRTVYDLHVTNDTYKAHRPNITHKSIIQHKKIPTNWAQLYLAAV